MEIQILKTQLRVYQDGRIERFHKQIKKWTLVKGVNQKGYLRIGIDGIKFLMHRIIAFVYLDFDLYDTVLELDHINRVKNDNRVENLRVVTHSQNMINRTFVNAKGYHKDGNSFKAEISINGKKISKYFKNEEDAKDQYLQWVQEYR